MSAQREEGGVGAGTNSKDQLSETNPILDRVLRSSFGDDGALFDSLSSINTAEWFLLQKGGRTL